MTCGLDRGFDLAKEEDEDSVKESGQKGIKWRITNSFPTGHGTAGSQW